MDTEKLNSREHAAFHYHFDDVTVERERFVIKKSGALRSLTPRAFDVLLYLIEHRGRVVEKQEIFEHVWKETFVTDNALSRSIKEIRQTIGDDSRQAKYIETMHKRGYRFIAEVEVSNGHQIIDEEIAKDGAEENNGNGSKALTPQLSTTSVPAATRSGNAAQRKSALRRPAANNFIVFAVAFCGLLTAAILVWTIFLKPSAETAKPLKVTRITTWSGLDVNPTLSPDASAVAYSSDHNGSFEIYVRPLAPGSRELQITSDDEQNFDPAWSPDGKLIAYYSMKRGGIWLVPALGGVAKQLTNFGSHPVWSPDGKMVAFHSLASPDLGAVPVGASTIWTIPAQGGAPKQVTRTGNPAGAHVSPTWSPDGQRIAFVNADQTSSQIWSASISGDDLKQITQRFTPDKSDPVYAPDGQSIYFTIGATLWKRALSQPSGEPYGSPIKVADMGDAAIRHLTISANGKQLAYSAWTVTSAINSLPLSPRTNEPTAEPRPLTIQRGVEFINPTFSPDGQKIAFTAAQRGINPDIWLMSADGSNAKQLTISQATSHPPNRFPNWFPTGDRIAFLSRRQEQRKLWTVTIDGGREEPWLPLDDGMEVPRLSPDAKQVAFNFNRDGIVNVGATSVTGGEPRQLTFDKEFAGFACWSPDGQFLAFQTKHGDDTHVSVIPSNGGVPTQLTFDQGQSWPNSWSPDGERIVFAGSRDGIWNIWWVSRADKTEKRLTRYTQLNAYVRRPTWSPLGDQIVYEHVEITGNIYVVDLN
ncbi:MAG TPA: winged helix-turn-helix domain-containing protein [Pyrinomonadaceae bacterium]|nr:winged helix-turn-helix domain-containing protein [Pyrinomonadaceae bacterium]